MNERLTKIVLKPKYILGSFVLSSTWVGEIDPKTFWTSVNTLCQISYAFQI